MLFDRLYNLLTALLDESVLALIQAAFIDYLAVKKTLVDRYGKIVS